MSFCTRRCFWVVMLFLWSCVSAGTDESSRRQTTSDKDFEYRVVSYWSSGFEASVKIKRPTGWIVEFDYPYTISSIWDASISSHVGSHYIIKGPNWASSSFGFIGKGGDGSIAPTNVTFKGD